MKKRNHKILLAALLAATVTLSCVPAAAGSASPPRQLSQQSSQHTQIPIEDIAEGMNLGNGYYENIFRSWQIGSMGTGYVNAFNGNFVFSLSGLYFPMGFNYNSRGSIETEFGSKISTTFNETVEELAEDAFLLTERDGSRHYFTYDSTLNWLADERGSRLDIYEQMVDVRRGTGHQTFMRDSGRQTNVACNENNQMTEAFGSSGTFSFDYYPATAERTGRIKSLHFEPSYSSYPKMDATFGYNAKGNLSAMVFSNGVSLVLTYDSTGELVTGVQDLSDGSRLDIDYIDNGDGPRVSSIRYTRADGVVADALRFVYGRDSQQRAQTTVTDMLGQVSVFTYDEMGRPVS